MRREAGRQALAERGARANGGALAVGYNREHATRRALAARLARHRAATVPRLVVELRRIPELALYRHDDAMQGAVAHLRQRLQRLDNLQQEGIAILSGEWCRAGEDGHRLRISQGDRRRHGGEIPRTAAG